MYFLFELIGSKVTLPSALSDQLNIEDLGFKCALQCIYIFRILIINLTYVVLNKVLNS